jgi:hypothetical protein
LFSYNQLDILVVHEKPPFWARGSFSRDTPPL